MPSAAPGTIEWADPQRAAAFDHWLHSVAPRHGLQAASVRAASADASFRRYFRIDAAVGASRADPAARVGDSAIIMDAPPAHEDTAAFTHVDSLMAAAGLQVPRILERDATHGFLLMTDLGDQTLLERLDPTASGRADPQAALPWYRKAVDALLQWQLASRAGELPAYDEALLRRELALFPDWYLARHRDVKIEGVTAAVLASSFDLIVARNLAAASVYVHRDFMPRNLMVARGATDADDAPLGVLDFQDAVYGPITYDIASLMRDAFLSWEEEMVIDVTVRYWSAARKAGLPVNDDFGDFYRAVEWMGLQRHLKVAGIFARLTLRDGKPRYLADAPRFIGYIRHAAARYRELTPLLRLIDRVEGSTPAVGFAYGRV
jgi:aminoglycoside/choline kinase family phosphotransferase